MRHALSACLVLALAACDGGGATDADGGPSPTSDADPLPWPSCRTGPRFEGSPTEGALLVGEREDGGFVPFTDDHEAIYQWGFQGGTMIQPVIGVPLAVAGDERCFEVTLRHLPDPDAPDAYGDVGRFASVTLELETTVDGDAVWTEPIFDQIGETNLDGVRLLLEVTVRGASFALTETVAIEVVDDSPAACRALESIGGEGGGCSYRLVLGEGVVLSIEPHEPAPGASSCPDPRNVQVRFEPTDPEAAVCYERFVEDPTTSIVIGPYALLPPASCLDGIEVGSRIPMTLQVIEGGSCIPYDYVYDLPDCVAACPDADPYP